MNSPFFFHLLNGLLMVGMPLALAVYLTRRFHSGWRLAGRPASCAPAIISSAIPTCI